MNKRFAASHHHVGRKRRKSYDLRSYLLACIYPGQHDNCNSHISTPRRLVAYAPPRQGGALFLSQRKNCEISEIHREQYEYTAFRLCWRNMPSVSTHPGQAPSWNEQHQPQLGSKEMVCEDGSPPEVIQRLNAIPATTGLQHGSSSSSSTLQVTRQGLRLSSSSSKHFGNRSWNSPPEEHLWTVPAPKRRISRGRGGGNGVRFPLQSPIRPHQWWRNPPSPLVSHMRPLWESASGSGYTSDDFILSSSTTRAPEEGEPLGEMFEFSQVCVCMRLGLV